jgi:divalent metal cation (Fe/Co/Zn/Cd) transporter
MLTILGIIVLLTSAVITYWLFDWSRGVAEDTKRGDSIQRAQRLHPDSPYIIPAATLDSIMNR